MDSIKCPQCGMVSYNPHDIRERYCGNCHQFHDFMPNSIAQPAAESQEASAATIGSSHTHLRAVTEPGESPASGISSALGPVVERTEDDVRAEFEANYKAGYGQLPERGPRGGYSDRMVASKWKHYLALLPGVQRSGAATSLGGSDLAPTDYRELLSKETREALEIQERSDIQNPTPNAQRQERSDP